VSLREKYERLEAQTRELEIKTGRPIPWMFHRNGRPVRDFRTAWKNACEKAKIGHRLFHDYRRSAVRNMERARVPRSAAMKVTGHLTESIYKRYAITDAEMMGEATKRIEQRGGQTASVPEQPSLPQANNGQTITKHTNGDDSN
jgi:integrase